MHLLLPLVVLLLVGIKRPGVLAAGLLFCYPASLVANVEGVTIAYSAASVLVASLYYLQGKQLTLNRLDLAAALFLAFVLLSSLWSPNLSHGANSAFAFTAAFCGVYLVGKLTFSVGDGEARCREFVFALCGLAAIYGLLVPNAADLGSTRLTIGGEGGVAVGITQAYVAALVAAIALPFQTSSGRLHRMAIAIIVLPISINIILLAETRGVLLSTSAGLAFYLFAVHGRRRLLRNVAIAAGFVGLTIIIAPALIDVQETLDSRLFNFSTYGSDTDASSIARIVRFNAAAQLFMENPVIGGGAGAFSYETTLGYPHNLFLEVAADYGLVGLVLLLVLAFFAVKAVRENELLRPNSNAAIFVAIIFAGLIQQQVSFSLSMAKPLFLIGCLSVMNLTSSSAARHKERRAVPDTDPVPGVYVFR